MVQTCTITEKIPVELSINRNDKLFKEFFEKKIVKTNQITFPKQKTPKIKKVFSNYLVDYSNPKANNLLFETIKEKRNLMKNEAYIYGSRMNKLKNITESKSKQKILFKSQEKSKISSKKMKRDNLIIEDENLKKKDSKSNNQSPQKGFIKNQTINILEINKETNLPIVDKESVRPKFDFHKYKNKFEYPYTQSICVTEELPNRDYPHKNFDLFNNDKKRFYNLFKNQTNYISKDIISNTKSRVFSGTHRSESLGKHIPKRIFSGLSTNYNGKNIISFLNINDNLTQNLNYEIKNINLAEKAKLSKTSNNFNLRPQTCRYIQGNILDYEELKSEKHQNKNDENLVINHLDGEQLYQIDINLEKVINHNYASYSKNRDLLSHRKMKIVIDENPKLKVSFAVQKDDDMTNIQDFASVNDQVLKTYNSLNEHEKQKLLKNNCDKNTDLANFYDENDNYKEEKNENLNRDNDNLKDQKIHSININKVKSHNNKIIEIEDEKISNTTELTKFNQILNKKNNFDKSHFGEPSIMGKARNFIYEKESCSNNEFSKKEESVPLYKNFENDIENKILTQNDVQRENYKSSDYETYFNQSINSIEKESKDKNKNNKIKTNKKKTNNFNHSYESSLSSQSKVTYIIPRKNKTFIEGNRHQMKINELIPTPKNNGQNQKLRPITAFNSFRNEFKLRFCRMISNDKRNYSKDSIRSQSYYILGDKKIRDLNVCNNKDLKDSKRNIHSSNSKNRDESENNCSEVFLNKKKIINNKNEIDNFIVGNHSLNSKNKDNSKNIQQSNLQTIKLKLSQEIAQNTKNIMKIHPLPKAMNNLNFQVKTKKLNQDIFSNSHKMNTEENIKENINNRYRKKKINIEDILVQHNSLLRKDVHPLKTTEIHMKSSLDKINMNAKTRPTTSINCFNKNETFSLKREFLNSFEKHAVDLDKKCE